MKKDISRREFLKVAGAGTAAAALAACAGKATTQETETSPTEPPAGKMTYRTNPKSGDKTTPWSTV